MKKKIKRERILILASAILIISVIVVATYLIGILGRSLNKFLSTGSATATSAIEFNFDAYDQLDL